MRRLSLLGETVACIPQQRFPERRLWKGPDRATRIMVLNDTQEILELFREILELEGYKVILNGFAPNELQEIERPQPGRIILDVIFGDERPGWQLLQKLRMRRWYSSHIRGIIRTAPAKLVLGLILAASRGKTGPRSAKTAVSWPGPFPPPALLRPGRSLTVGSLNGSSWEWWHRVAEQMLSSPPMPRPPSGHGWRAVSVPGSPKRGFACSSLNDQAQRAVGPHEVIIGQPPLQVGF